MKNEFESRTKQYPNANYWLITYTRGGFSKEFEAKLGRYNVQWRVPIQFFDTEFKIDVAPEARSAIEPVLTSSKSLRYERIPQPYSILTEGQYSKQSDDLLEYLLDKFSTPKGANLHIVVGPAGIGKSWLFQDLFSRLYGHFKQQKLTQETFARPVPFFSQHLLLTGGMQRLQDLMASFIETEFVAKISLKTFKWMLTQGYIVWLFDGLDELYAGDQNFFIDLLELLTEPDSQAQILICARESLLKSSETLTEFLSDYSADPSIHIYRLDGWEHLSKRAFAQLHFDPPRDSRFLTYISRSDSLKSLSSSLSEK